MQLRRTLATTSLLIALTAPLSACGFNYATDRVYTPAAGSNDRDGVVDVLAAVVVSGQEGSGTFVATLSNGDTEDEIALTSVTGAGESAVEVAEFEPVAIGPGALVNLAQPPAPPIVLTGDFGAGNFLTLTLDFDNGESATLNVPVLDDSGDYEGLDSSATAS